MFKIRYSIEYHSYWRILDTDRCCLGPNQSDNKHLSSSIRSFKNTLHLLHCKVTTASQAIFNMNMPSLQTQTAKTKFKCAKGVPPKARLQFEDSLMSLPCVLLQWRYGDSASTGNLFQVSKLRLVSHQLTAKLLNDLSIPVFGFARRLGQNLQFSDLVLSCFQLSLQFSDLSGACNNSQLKAQCIQKVS